MAVCDLETNLLKGYEKVEDNLDDEFNWYHPNYERNAFELLDEYEILK